MHPLPPPLVPCFLGRVLWGSAALGEQPEPPHAALAGFMAGQGG